MGKKKKNKQQQQVKPKVATTVSTSKIVKISNVNEHPECVHNNGKYCKLGTTCSNKSCKAFHNK